MKQFLLFFGFLFMIASMVVAERGHHDGHGHGNVKPSHGGEILEVGHHVAHIELVHSKKNGKVILYILNGEGETMGIGDAPRLNLFYQDNGVNKKKQIITKALNLKDGRSHTFDAEDSLFKSSHIEGKIAIKINDKIYQVTLHHHHGGHDGHAH